MKVVGMIQARMASSRLPGKVLIDLAGKPVLSHVVERVSGADMVDTVVVATTSSDSDDAVEEFCRQEGVACFRGSEDDVLDRLFQAAIRFDADVVVRVTADCPLVDPVVINDTIKYFLDGGYDYASNGFHRTYPAGVDAEVFSRQALERAWRDATLKSEREHVTAYMKERPDEFRIGWIEHQDDLSAMRWTLDEPRDLEFIRAVHAHLQPSQLRMNDVLEVLRRHPELGDINEGIEYNEGYQKSLREDCEVNKVTGQGQSLYKAAKARIPGGTQLLSKRPEMFLPEQWPSYFDRAQGVDVWDLDGNKFIDMSYNGIGACALGVGDPDVDAAVLDAIRRGTMSTLNCPEEVELADLLCELHPWASMVRYARTGGEAMAIAVRIARAHTQRDTVAFCGYHGWHDWYLSANLAEEHALDGHLLPGLEPAGVPRGLLGTAVPFRYNRIAELKAIVDDRNRELAAIVMEPVRGDQPQEGFLETVREIATDIGAVLVVDEISAGFRLTTGGAHLIYGLRPDIAVFGKAISNGYPMAAVIGRDAVMEAAQRSFISSTYWTERTGPSAALATIRKHSRCNVPQHLSQIGRRVKEGWEAAAERAGLRIEVSGMDPVPHFAFLGDDPRALKTLLVQLMLDRGFLASNCLYATYAHQNRHVDRYLEAVAAAFEELACAIESKNVGTMLKGPVAHAGFHRLT